MHHILIRFLTKVEGEVVFPQAESIFLIIRGIHRGFREDTHTNKFLVEPLKGLGTPPPPPIPYSDSFFPPVFFLCFLLNWPPKNDLTTKKHLFFCVSP